MVRSLAVVAVIVAIIFVINRPPSEEPVSEVDPVMVATSVATVAPFPVLVPTDAGWQGTTARWEPTEASADAPVWFTGGVYGVDGPFASVSQSTAAGPEYLAEQTVEGSPLGTAATIDGTAWQRYESTDRRSLVHGDATGTTVATGTGSWDDVERFAASLSPVPTG